MAIRCVHRTFYGLQHQYDMENAQKSHIVAMSGSIQITSRRWKKRTAILFSVVRTRFKCASFIVNKSYCISRDESVMKLSIQSSHRQQNVLHSHISGKNMSQRPRLNDAIGKFRFNIHRFVTPSSEIREIILTELCVVTIRNQHGNKFRCDAVFVYVCC